MALTIRLPAEASGQDIAYDRLPVRTDTLTVAGSGPFLLRPFLIEGSILVQLDGLLLSPDSIRVDHRDGFLFLPDRTDMSPSQLLVTYRYIPISVARTLRRWPLRAESDREGDALNALGRRRSSPSLNGVVPAGQALTRSGSITRGITTGSGRDVAIESGLRLQVEGQLIEGLDLRAVLTDENTPILPEGSTQRLNDFDRVFIELQSSFGTVQLGDIDGRIDGGQFGQLNRKLQGVAASAHVGHTGVSPFLGGKITAAAATSRGLFREQSITPVDGVQGPYRLEGANGERFIILLPGSEVVYMDGIRLQRGGSADYVVDYATGEITFTARRIVSADRRISVEFQYTTQQFTRTIVAADAAADFGFRSGGLPLLSIGISAIREADGDQFSEEFGLTAADSIAISQAGDESAFRSGATQVIFDPEALFTQYVIEHDTTTNGSVINYFRVVREAPSDSTQVYRVSFSRVSDGSGSYRRTGLVTNGIAYEYAGEGLGEYAPLRPLPKPSLHQLVDARAVVRPFPLLRLSGEWAFSRLDLNRLSGLDAGDDEGSAYQMELAIDPVPLNLNIDTEIRVDGALRRYFRDVDFASFERIRPVEYARRWNIQNARIDASRGLAEFGDEWMTEGDVGIAWSDSSRISGSIGRLELGDTFVGERWNVRLLVQELSVPNVDYRIEQIASADERSNENGTWTRQIARLSDEFVDRSLQPYIEVEHEDLLQFDTSSDSLVAPSVRFLETRAGFQWLKTRYSIGLDAEKRTEKRIQSGQRVPFDAWTVSTRVTASPQRSIHTEFELGYRITDGLPAPDAPQAASNESYIVGTSGRWSPGRQGSDISWMYQARTERSATLQEIYIRAGQDRGEYVWEDENMDGVIQLEEFLPETTPEEGLYVRTFIPSDSLESVTSVRARLRVELNTGRETTSDFLQIFKGLNSVTLVDIEEKSRDPKRENVYFLKLGRFQTADNTLNGRIRLRQDIGLLRNLRRADLRLTVQTLRSLTELAAGEESRNSDLGRITLRYTLNPMWQIGLAVDRTLDALRSESFTSRNYSIATTIVTPSFTWSPAVSVRFSIAPALSRKTERISGGSATIIRAPVDGQYGIGRKVDMTARFEVSSVSMNSVYVGRTAFEMTDGRGDGTSYLWRLGLQSNLSEVLTATFSYDGRAPESRPVIHTARFQLSARF